MLIDCPGCARSYHVSPDDLGPRGRTLVCPRCERRWHQDAADPIGKGRTFDLDASGVSTRAAPALDEVALPPRSFVSVPRPVVAVCAAVVACLAVAGLLIGRDTIVRKMPRTAALYAVAGLRVNVVGLVFAGLESTRLPSSDVTIRGAIRNVSAHRVSIPRLAFEVRDAAGVTLVAWNETVSAKALAPGRNLAFASTPHRLPAESRTMLVRFE